MKKSSEVVEKVIITRHLLLLGDVTFHEGVNVFKMQW